MSKLFFEKCQELPEVRAAFDWASRKKAIITECGICGSSDYDLIADKERHGIPVPWHFCNRCGTVYAGERLTAEGQADFYRNWYQKFMSAYWEQGYGPRRYLKEQRKYLARPLPFLKKQRLLPRTHGRILDVGGAIGLIAAGIGKAAGSCHVTILDPCLSDLKEAQKKRGCAIIEGCVETADLRKKKYDLILHCRSLEHVFDPVAFFRIARAHLHSHGRLFVDYVQLEITLPKRGVPHSFQIDHIHNFSHDVFLKLAARAGFLPASSEWQNALERGFVFKIANAIRREKKTGWSSDNVASMRERIEKFRDRCPRHRAHDGDPCPAQTLSS